MSKVTDDKLIYFEFSGTEDELDNLLNNFFHKIANDYSDKINTIRYKMRYYDNKEYGFIWLAPSCLGIGYALVGKNWDGTDRSYYEVDKNWVHPTEKEIENVKRELDKCNNWALISELEDKLENMVIRPRKKILLQPLVSHPIIKFEPGYALSPTEGYVNNRLVSLKGPQWAKLPKNQRYANDKFKMIFNIYSSDVSTKYSRTIYNSLKQKKIKITDNYPFIDISRSGTIYITFDKDTNDAAIALLMSGTSNVENPQTKEIQQFKFWFVKK